MFRAKPRRADLPNQGSRGRTHTSTPSAISYLTERSIWYDRGLHGTPRREHARGVCVVKSPRDCLQDEPRNTQKCGHTCTHTGTHLPCGNRKPQRFKEGGALVQQCMWDGALVHLQGVQNGGCTIVSVAMADHILSSPFTVHTCLHRGADLPQRPTAADLCCAAVLSTACTVPSARLRTSARARNALDCAAFVTGSANRAGLSTLHPRRLEVYVLALWAEERLHGV